MKKFTFLIFGFAICFCFPFSAIATISPITGGSSICVGRVLPLTDATTGGTWSSSSTAIAVVSSATGAVTGESAGTATITYTVGGSSVTALVTVDSNPNVVVGELVMCSGMSTSLSDATPGGTWSSANTLAATVGSVTGVVSGIAAGTSVISYILGTGCFTTVTVTINAWPGAITSSATSVCVGSTVDFSDATTGGVWSSSNTAIGGIGVMTGVLTGISAGTTVITYSSGGCIASMVMTVSGITTLSGPGGVCVGSNITLTPSLAGGTWSSTAPATAFVGTGSGLVTGMSDGTAVIIYATLGCTAKDTILVGNVFGVVTNTVSSTCTDPDFYVSACGISSAYNVTCYFGDGTSSNTPLSSTGICHADVLHAYAAPGTYTVKEVLYNGTTPVDSGTFTYNYFFCRYLPLKFYFDANTNCVMDAGEGFNQLPILVAIDSNGIAIDTVSTTSGLYYKAYGTAGTVYGFRVVDAALVASCAAASVVYDTIQTIVDDYPVKYYGLYCSGVSGYDLSMTGSMIAGRHAALGTLVVNNGYCTPQNAVVTATFSSEYIFYSASPVATSVVGNTITWDLSSLSVSSGAQNLDFILTIPSGSAYLLEGDTIRANYAVTPVTGDLDPGNNYVIIITTITGSFDPNEMSVSPTGYVGPGTKLQYTINFENTGNDTAFNISVYDTLPDNVAVNSLRIVAASAVMNTTLINDGAHNIVKFDFPGINLLDSSYHNQCNGMVVFTINALAGLPQCTAITNDAGIYFDYNPVVMTNSVTNMIGIPPFAGPITGMDTVCAGLASLLSDTTSGGVWSVSNSNASITAGSVTGNATGIDTVYYTVTNVCGGTASARDIIYVQQTSDCANSINKLPTSLQSVSIFPNPPTNVLSIIQSPSAYTTFTITNSIGQNMIQQPLTTTQTTVNVATLPPGLYYITFRGDNGTSVQKFVKL